VSKVPLSLLDLASIGEGETVHESLNGCVTVAQKAEQLGYTRVWYAEHHNSQSIASSAPAVLIAHVAANTSTIRLGSGGVMLPNHSPLVIAEQFGTLAELHPGRIDIGLGRAPGTDQNTFRALRRDPRAAEHFAQDVVELQGFLSHNSRVEHVQATPGYGTFVPLYILGSSLFGAQLAALLGLPFAFASHFAPQHLHEALHIYRERFTPSAQLDKPHAMASMNIIAADSTADAERQLERRRRVFAKALFGGPGNRLSDEEVTDLLNSPRAQYLNQIFTYSAVGDTQLVKEKVNEFLRAVEPDELMVVHHCENTPARLRSMELLSEAMQ
jgi:luciferase family oxidoreductase group 1